MRTYLPKWIQLFLLGGVLWFWSLSMPVLAGIIFFSLLVLYVLFLRRNIVFSGSRRKEAILSPVSGTVQSVSKESEDALFEGKLTRVEALVPWWKSKGIFLPFASEVRDVVTYENEIKLTLKKSEGKGQEFLSMCFPCKSPRVRPRLVVLPGDRGGAGVSVGHFLWQSTIYILFPEKHKLKVGKGSVLRAGETVLAEPNEV